MLNVKKKQQKKKTTPQKNNHMQKSELTDPLEYRFLVVAPFHEENNFPTCVAIHRINLKDRSILFYFIYI